MTVASSIEFARTHLHTYARTLVAATRELASPEGRNEETLPKNQKKTGKKGIHTLENTKHAEASDKQGVAGNNL